ncbi:hypothetical protein [Kineothrix sedimenti]|uniref:Phage protein n=1 Tax=Kineothrix sedimenti TaxID=3123317 RepID=A0ABZ3EUG5_9FIRM
MSNEVSVAVVSVFEHFKSNIDGSINGLYKIEINGNKATIFRNGDSWGVLAYYLGEDAHKCMGYLRADRIEVVERAISEYIKSKGGYAIE